MACDGDSLYSSYFGNYGLYKFSLTGTNARQFKTAFPGAIVPFGLAYDDTKATMYGFTGNYDGGIVQYDMPDVAHLLDTTLAGPDPAAAVLRRRSVQGHLPAVHGAGADPDDLVLPHHPQGTGLRRGGHRLADRPGRHQRSHHTGRALAELPRDAVRDVHGVLLTREPVRHARLHREPDRRPACWPAKTRCCTSCPTTSGWTPARGRYAARPMPTATTPRPTTCWKARSAWCSRASPRCPAAGPRSPRCR